MATWTATLTHNATNLSANTEYRVSMFNGRRSTSDQMRGLTMTVSLFWGDGSLDPNNFQVNDTVTLTVTPTGQAGQTFTVLVTDVRVDRNLITLTGINRNYSRLGRTTLDLPAYDNQLTGAVLNAALTAAQTAGIIDSAWSSAVTKGTAYVSTTAGNYNLLAFLQSVANSEPLGMLTGNPATQPLFLDYNDFRNTAPNFLNNYFDYSAINGWAYEWELNRSASDFVNTAVVNYTGGTATFADTASVASVGVYQQNVTTVLASATDADYLARRLVAFGTDPGYRVNELRFDLAALTDLQLRNQLLNGRPGRRLSTPTVFPGGPTEWVIQGLADSIEYSAGAKNWYRTFYVIDRAYWDAAQRWQDVTSGVQWNTVNPAYTWVDLERNDI